MSIDFIKIGTTSDAQIDANFIELQKVIKSLQNDINDLIRRIKSLEAK